MLVCTCMEKKSSIDILHTEFWLFSKSDRLLGYFCRWFTNVHMNLQTLLASSMPQMFSLRHHSRTCVTSPLWGVVLHPCDLWLMFSYSAPVLCPPTTSIIYKRHQTLKKIKKMRLSSAVQCDFVVLQKSMMLSKFNIKIWSSIQFYWLWNNQRLLEQFAH